MRDAFPSDSELADLWASDPVLQRLLVATTREDFLSLTSLVSRHGAAVFEELEDLSMGQGGAQSSAPALSPTTAVIEGWRRRLDDLFESIDRDLASGSDRDRAMDAGQVLVKAVVSGLRTRYRVRRGDAQANDVLSSLVGALGDLEKASSTERAWRAAAAWMLHRAEIRPLSPEQAAAVARGDEDEVTKVAEVVRRVLKRRSQSRASRTL